MSLRAGVQSRAATAQQHLLDRRYEERERLASAGLGLDNHVRACDSAQARQWYVTTPIVGLSCDKAAC